MAGATRVKRPEIKITVKDFNDLTTYCKAKEGMTPTKIVNTLVGEFLAREDVVEVIKAASVDKKKAAAIEKKKAMIEKLKAELAELEKEAE